MYTIYVKYKTGEIEKHHVEDKASANQIARNYAKQDDISRAVVGSVFDKTLFFRDEQASTGRQMVRKATLRKNYYLADDEYSDSIYGSDHPSCIDRAEIKLLGREWEMTTAELRRQMHEASAEEIAEHGIYNG